MWVEEVAGVGYGSIFLFQQRSLPVGEVHVFKNRFTIVKIYFRRFQYLFSECFFKIIKNGSKTDVAQNNIFSKSSMKRLQVHHTPKPREVSVSANEQQTLFPYLLVAFNLQDAC